MEQDRQLSDRPEASTPSAVQDAPVTPESAAHKGSLPSLSLPKGGGAIRGIGEKFSINPATGTPFPGSQQYPIARDRQDIVLQANLIMKF